MTLVPEARDQARFHDRMGYNSMDQNDVATRQSSQVVESKGTRLYSDLALCLGKIHEHPMNILIQQKLSTFIMLVLFSVCILLTIQN